MTQCDMILKHLEENFCITPKEAEVLYSVMRLSARIKDLRDDGHVIMTVPRTELNKFGKKTRFAEYRLIESKKHEN